VTTPTKVIRDTWPNEDGYVAHLERNAESLMRKVADLIDEHGRGS
jgi:predicted transcriptional regulator